MTKFDVTLWGRFLVTPEYDGENYDHDDVGEAADRSRRLRATDAAKYGLSTSRTTS